MSCYRITASIERAEQIVDSADSATLGDCLERVYPDRAAAAAAAQAAQDEIADYGLDPSTTYSVVEVAS